MKRQQTLGNPLVNTDPDGLWVTPQTVGGIAGLAVGFTYSLLVNDNDIGTALLDGLQAGAAGFISGGGSVFAGMAASGGAAALRSKLDCGEVDEWSVVLNSGFAALGGGIGRAAGALVPQNMVRVQRGFFWRLMERQGLLAPKMVDKKVFYRAQMATGAGAISENLMAGAYSGSELGKCPCDRK